MSLSWLSSSLQVSGLGCLRVFLQIKEIRNEGDSSSHGFEDQKGSEEGALTLLCWSRDAVLLGSGFSFTWLLWHLCDWGLLGNVVLCWFLQFGLEKGNEKDVGIAATLNLSRMERLSD